MTYATYHWEVVMRYAETSSPTSTTDFTLDFWVTGANSGERQANAEACAREQCKNMLTGTNPSRTCVVLSSSQIGTR